MARLSTSGSSMHDTTALNLTRLLARLQKILLSPDEVTEQRLRSSNYERSKVGTNLEYAKSLLLQLEQDSLGTKVQTRKQDTQSDLLKKRDVISQLSVRLQELDVLSDDIQDDSSEGEDLLGEDTPSDELDEQNLDITPPSESHYLSSSIHSSSVFESGAETDHQFTPPSTSGRDELFPSSLRARHSTLTQAPDVGRSTSSAHAGTSTAATEALLTHNRTEQESLTDSLLSMAQALKSSSEAFSNSLEEEKDVLGRTTDGLDKNTTQLEAASKRMGYLRRMSEGKGWWGRIMLYAWIFGLMFLAVFIVAFLPKLRF